MGIQQEALFQASPTSIAGSLLIGLLGIVMSFGGLRFYKHVIGAIGFSYGVLISLNLLHIGEPGVGRHGAWLALGILVGFLGSLLLALVLLVLVELAVVMVGAFFGFAIGFYISTSPTYITQVSKLGSTNVQTGLTVALIAVLATSLAFAFFKFKKSIMSIVFAGHGAVATFNALLRLSGENGIRYYPYLCLLGLLQFGTGVLVQNRWQSRHELYKKKLSPVNHERRDAVALA